MKYQHYIIVIDYCYFTCLELLHFLFYMYYTYNKIVEISFVINKFLLLFSGADNNTQAGAPQEEAVSYDWYV